MDANERGNAEVMGAKKESKESSSNAEELQVVGSLGSISSTGNADRQRRFEIIQALNRLS